mgnify:CR=1 FL=1
MTHIVHPVAVTFYTDQGLANMRTLVIYSMLNCLSPAH